MEGAGVKLVVSLTDFASVVDPDPDLIRNQWGPWIRIRIRNLNLDPRGQNGPEKYRRKQLINFI